MSETIAAIATPQAAGGIGIVRISGENACEIADRVFTAADKTTLTDSNGYAAHFGHVYDDTEKIDDAIALVFKAPKSYTGEDVVELQCHGGLYVIRNVLRSVLKHGARIADAGEFTRRAFENGKMSLTQAEAVMDLISAQGQQAARAAINAMEGKLYIKINRIKNDLIGYAAHLSAWADYPEEDLIPVDEDQLSCDLGKCVAELNKMIADADAGKVMATLFYEPSTIVTHIAGTTRDIVEEKVVLGDVILRLADTAGIHDTDDPVETIGVDRALDRMNSAGLVIAVFDNSMPLDDDDRQLIENLKGRNCVAVINKTDISGSLDTSFITESISRTVYISAKNESGIEELSKAISDILGVSNLNPADGILSGERQINCCRNCLNMVADAQNALNGGMTLDAVNISIDCAIQYLLELTGERVTEVVTDAVFHHFCVGK